MKLLDAFRQPENSATASPGASDGESVMDFAQVKESLKAGRSNRKSRLDENLQAKAEANALDELFAPENWEAIVSMYFDARYAMTGFEDFQLTDVQKKILSTSFTPCMRLLLKIDPRYVALLIFSVNFGGLILRKEMAYAAAQKPESKKAL